MGEIETSDLRENLELLIGSLGTAIGVAISWFVSTEIFTILIAVLIGFLSSYFLQRITQKRAWKREYSVKIAEEVYGDLFKNVRDIIRGLQRKNIFSQSFYSWGQMAEDHRYFMVDEKFRKRLDDFHSKVEEYSSAVVEFLSRILPKIINREVKRLFKISPHSAPNISVNYKKDKQNVSASVNFSRCLTTNTHPIEKALEYEDRSEISDIECVISIPRKSSPHYSFSDLKKINELSESCLRHMKEHKTYIFILKEKKRLLEEAREVREKIVKRIEKPWRI